MRLSMIAGLALASVAMCGCAGTTLFQAPVGASPAAQDAMTQAKAEADAALVKALTDKIAHCGVTGTLQFGVGGLAATGTGVADTVQLACPGQAYGPYDISPTPSVTPLAQMPTK